MGNLKARGRRFRRRGDDIPPISAYAHWNEDAERIWYEENRYDMEHADEIIEDEDFYEDPEDEEEDEEEPQQPREYDGRDGSLEISQEEEDKLIEEQNEAMALDAENRYPQGYR